MKPTHTFFTAMGLAAILGACSDADPVNPTSVPAVTPKTDNSGGGEIDLSRFARLPTTIESPENAIAPEKVVLGQTLFFEKRLSLSQTISCNSCHALDRYGVDGERFSKGHEGQLGGRNAPTVYNAAGHVAQFWDGRAATLEDQAKGPVLNPVEMAMPNAEAVEAVLESIPEYKAAFARAFPGDQRPLSFGNMARAIGAFERGLNTPSRWDDYLGGTKGALTDEELRGLRAFVGRGCADCHDGATVGGTRFKKLGVERPWTRDPDTGRFQVTEEEKDRQVFKVPSLRNIAKTGPYFHDGSVASLEEAVSLMGAHQAGVELDKSEVEAIVAWLGSLTGALPLERIAEPELPKGPVDKAGSSER